MKTELIDFVRLKIADVEKAIRAREQAQATFLSGTDESWAQAAKMHPSTASKPMKKAERMEVAASQGRILIKLRHELAMFNEILKALLE